MFDEPEESPGERPAEPSQRAKEKADEFRMHAELAAVFEGNRKFDAQLRPQLDPELARDIQRRVAKLEKSKPADSPLIPQESVADAIDVLKTPQTRDLPTNDYHIYRRPGEVMIVRWLQGDEVEAFYERLQAHFDAALEGFKEDERQANEWKNDPGTQAYLDALNTIEVKMADRYAREIIRQHRVFILSTQSADEIDILHLADYLMSVAPEEIVGPVSAPPAEATEQDRAWFFKLFSLRGIVEGIERMCFFVYMQKTDDWDS